MKKLIGTDLGTYAFNAAAKTVTLTGLSALVLEQVLLISNATTGAIIYSFADSAKGATLTGSAAAGYVLTLETSTAGMANNDRLQIFVDLPEPQGVAVADLAAVLRNLMAILADPMWLDPATSRVRVALESAAVTMTGVTTVATVTSLSQIAGFSAKDTALNALEDVTWANAIRSLIA